MPLHIELTVPPTDQAKTLGGDQYQSIIHLQFDSYQEAWRWWVSLDMRTAEGWNMADILRDAIHHYVGHEVELLDENGLYVNAFLSVEGKYSEDDDEPEEKPEIEGVEMPPEYVEEAGLAFAEDGKIPYHALDGIFICRQEYDDGTVDCELIHSDRKRYPSLTSLLMDLWDNYGPNHPNPIKHAEVRIGNINGGDSVVVEEMWRDAHDDVYTIRHCPRVLHG